MLYNSIANVISWFFKTCATSRYILDKKIKHIYDNP